MKRLIAVILSVAMLIPSVVFSAEEEIGKYTEEMTILKSFNTISYFNESHDENTLVTRAELVTSVLELAYKDFSMYQTENFFSDVDENASYAGAIAFARQAGLISGVGDSEFRPDTAITVGQALKVLLLAMNYGTHAEEMGGFPNGFYSLAQRIGVLDGVAVSVDQPLLAGQLAKIILNAGFLEIAQISYKNGSYSYTNESSMTFFEDVHQIYEGEGVLSENEYTALTDIDGRGGCLVTIGNFEGYSYNDIKAEEYMGYYVDYYYRETDFGNNVLYITPDENRNKVIIVEGENVASFNNGVLSYYKSTNSSGTKSEVIPLNASVIYNGRLITSYGNTEFVGITGQIKLIDNNSDGVVDVVNIVAYENFVVNIINNRDNVIYDLIDGSNTISFENDGKVNAFVIWDNEGNRVKITDLQKYDVLTIAKSKDGEYIRALFNKQVISGTVKAKFEEKGKNYINIDGVKYEIEKKCHTKFDKEISIGTNITVYTDVLGRIAYVETTASKEGFAVVIKGINELEETGRAAIKLMDTTGKIAFYSLAEKVTLDGKRYDECDKVPNDVLSSNLIRFKLNSNNEIYWIDTPQSTNEDGGSVYKMKDITESKYITNSKSLSGVLQFGAGMVILNIPSNKATAEDEDYSVGSSSNFENGEKYTGEIYAVSKNAIVPDVFVVIGGKNEKLTYTSATAVIAGAAVSVNDNDEVVDALTLMSSKNGVFNISVNRDDNVFANSGAEVGDVIKYATDSKGEIIDMEVIFDARTKTLNHNTQAGRSTPLTGLGTYYDSLNLSYLGTIHNREEKILHIKVDGSIINNATSGIKSEDMYFDISGIASKIITVDTTQTRLADKVYMSDAGELADAVHFGTGSTVYFYTTYGVPNMFVVYK